MNVSKYAVEDRNGEPLVLEMFDEDEYAEARDCAQEFRGRLIEYTFEFADSELIEDYTEDQSTVTS